MTASRHDVLGKQAAWWCVTAVIFEALGEPLVVAAALAVVSAALGTAAILGRELTTPR